MSRIAQGRTWEEASSPAATRLARRYETAWRKSTEVRPDPSDFLPTEPNARPAALLALLRTDLALHWESRQPIRVEWYRDRYPDLRSDALVGLLYEEFCLREEAGERPRPEEYEARFPEVASQLREILDIHELVGSTRSYGFKKDGASGVAFPEVGQTIAGFHLVEELGRGTFARVFRAEERRLANRSVALKVARTGSREPQTLARLQHTNIVPVHSYWIDPATGLHLMCMPYFGRVTLARVLSDPAARSARNGADLVAVLERLQPPDERVVGVPASESPLIRLPFARAIAWWGARMAEALQHAHERGVLHRDIKPSNVLLTADGMPMLLDFNLADDPWRDDPAIAPPTLGGTLAYMAPEHLEALLEAQHGLIDRRSDLYSLGMVLLEALGSRPFPYGSQAHTAPDSLQWVLEARRAGAPPLREEHPEVPAALATVVSKCLAPDRADRYATAAELAADLQAVADDGPLRHCREPQPSRSLRWLRRNRRRLAVAVPIVLASLALTVGLFRTQEERLRSEAKARMWLDEGQQSLAEDKLDRATYDFAMAAVLSRGRHGLHGVWERAQEGRALAMVRTAARRQADQFFDRIAPLRFSLMQHDADRKATSSKVESLIGLYGVLTKPRWADGPEVQRLDTVRRARLLEEMNELLFVWVVASDRLDDPEMMRSAVGICDVALHFADPKGPWRVLRARYASRLNLESSSPGLADDPSSETSARASFQWGLLSKMEGNRALALAWLDRATVLRPDSFWYRFAAGFEFSQAGAVDRALNHYAAALALWPDSSWARFNRAQLDWSAKGDWTNALAELRRVAEKPEGIEPARVQLELGHVFQRLGDYPNARLAYERTVDMDDGGVFAGRARLNQITLDAEAGDFTRAMAGYDRFLSAQPLHATSRRGRALLSLYLGRPGPAEADLTQALSAVRGASERAETLADRALARLELDRPDDAEADAAEAFRLTTSPGHMRLWRRCLLASGRALELDGLSPEEVARWPGNGTRLAADLRATEMRLRARTDAHNGVSAYKTALVLAVVSSALGRHEEAKGEASRAIALSPFSTPAYRVSAWVHRRAGDWASAAADVERGLEVAPHDPVLLTLRGCRKVEAGRPEEGLTDLDRAIVEGDEALARLARAEALLRLGRLPESVGEWTRVLLRDPEDAEAYLGRARAFLRGGQTDRALADLENAASWANRRADLLGRIALAYAGCLPEHPDRLPRVVALARRGIENWLNNSLVSHPRVESHD